MPLEKEWLSNRKAWCVVWLRVKSAFCEGKKRLGCILFATKFIFMRVICDDCMPPRAKCWMLSFFLMFPYFRCVVEKLTCSIRMWIACCCFLFQNDQILNYRCFWFFPGSLKSNNNWCRQLPFSLAKEVFLVAFLLNVKNVSCSQHKTHEHHSSQKPDGGKRGSKPVVWALAWECCFVT